MAIIGDGVLILLPEGKTRKADETALVTATLTIGRPNEGETTRGLDHHVNLNHLKPLAALRPTLNAPKLHCPPRTTPSKGRSLRLHLLPRNKSQTSRIQADLQQKLILSLFLGGMRSYSNTMSLPKHANHPPEMGGVSTYSKAQTCWRRWSLESAAVG